MIKCKKCGNVDDFEVRQTVSFQLIESDEARDWYCGSVEEYCGDFTILCNCGEIEEDDLEYGEEKYYCDCGAEVDCPDSWCIKCEEDEDEM